MKKNKYHNKNENTKNRRLIILRHRKFFTRLRKFIFAFNAFLLGLKNSLVQAFYRITLAANTKGIKLPWLNNAEQKLSKETVLNYKRKALLYRLRQSRYSYTRGPLWLRSMADAIASLWLLNAFWFVIALKMILGFIALTIPIALFSLLRGTLPVPERVPELPIFQKHAQKITTLQSFPYHKAKGGIDHEKDLTNSHPHLISTKGLRLQRAQTQDGLWTAQTGILPRKEISEEGYLIDSRNPALFEVVLPQRIEINRGNRMRFGIIPLPQQTEGEADCRIKASDENQNLIFSRDLPEVPAPGTFSEGLASIFQSRFTPDYFFSTLKKDEIFFDTNRPSLKLTVSVEKISTESQNGDTQSEKSPQCPVLFLPPKFEKQLALHNDRRGALVIVVQGLRDNEVADRKNAPNIWDFARTSAFIFRQHRVQSNIPEANLESLLGAEPNPFKQQTSENLVANRFRENGFATLILGNIANLPLLNNTRAEAFETRIHLAAPEYSARHITEDLLVWLQNHIDSAFFATAVYNALQPTYRPPFYEIDVFKFLSARSSFDRELLLRKSVLRSFDKEIASLFRRLKEIGIWESTDIILTSDLAMPLNTSSFASAQGTENGTNLSFKKRSSSLSDLEIKVPMIWKPAKTEFFSMDNKSKEILEPTTHTDIATTLLNLLPTYNSRSQNIGNRTNLKTTTKKSLPSGLQSGIDLSPQIQGFDNNNLENLFARRIILPIFGKHALGIIRFSHHRTEPNVKYVYQYSQQKLSVLSKHNWFQPEATILSGEKLYILKTPQKNLEDLTNTQSQYYVTEQIAPLSNLWARQQLPMLRENLREALFNEHTHINLNFSNETDLNYQFNWLQNNKNTTPPFLTPILLASSMLQSELTNKDGGYSLRIWGKAQAGEKILLKANLKNLLDARAKLVISDLASEHIASAPQHRYDVCYGAFSVKLHELLELAMVNHPCLIGQIDGETGKPLGKPKTVYGIASATILLKPDEDPFKFASRDL